MLKALVLVKSKQSLRQGRTSLIPVVNTLARVVEQKYDQMKMFAHGPRKETSSKLTNQG